MDAQKTEFCSGNAFLPAFFGRWQFAPSRAGVSVVTRHQMTAISQPSFSLFRIRRPTQRFAVNASDIDLVVEETERCSDKVFLCGVDSAPPLVSGDCDAARAFPRSCLFSSFLRHRFGIWFSPWAVSERHSDKGKFARLRATLKWCCQPFFGSASPAMRMSPDTIDLASAIFIAPCYGSPRHHCAQRDDPVWRDPPAVAVRLASHARPHKNADAERLKDRLSNWSHSMR